ncbi:hypothetical protein ACL598_05625 [Bordetella bronchialis]|uniref:hypothetical protein n=1 Tax=Bordetella bronchialis TaxID=463025 RepID=UPI003D013853
MSLQQYPIRTRSEAHPQQAGRPCVNVLEQMPVYRLQMRQVEVPDYWLRKQLIGTQRGECSFGPIEPVLARDVQTIPQYTGLLIGVGV